jgi:hypothetical protein
VERTGSKTRCLLVRRTCGQLHICSKQEFHNDAGISLHSEYIAVNRAGYHSDYQSLSQWTAQKNSGIGEVIIELLAS